MNSLSGKKLQATAPRVEKLASLRNCRLDTFIKASLIMARCAVRYVGVVGELYIISVTVYAIAHLEPPYLLNFLHIFHLPMAGGASCLN